MPSCYHKYRLSHLRCLKYHVTPTTALQVLFIVFTKSMTTTFAGGEDDNEVSIVHHSVTTSPSSHDIDNSYSDTSDEYNQDDIDDMNYAHHSDTNAFSTKATTSATGMNVVSESKTEAVVVCGVDGTIYTLDAWTGQLRGMFASGGTIVGSESSVRSSVPHDDIVGDENDDGHDALLKDTEHSFESSTLHERSLDETMTFSSTESYGNGMDPENDLSIRERIIPGLDGNIYSLTESSLYGENTEERLEVLPVHIEDVVNSPIQTCREKTNPTGNVFDTQEECGLVMGQKSTRIFAIDPLSGSLQWMQNPDSKENGFSSSRMGIQQSHEVVKPVLLQREDYSVRQVDVDTGDERWAVKMGKFNAIDFASSESLMASTTRKRDSRHQSNTSGNTIRTRVPSLPLRSDMDVGTRRRTHSRYRNDKSTSSRFTEESRYEDEEVLTDSFDPFPSFAFDSSGSSVLAIDSSTDTILWKRRIESFVVAVYGIGKEGRWLPLNMLDPIDDEVDDSYNESKESDCSASEVKSHDIVQKNDMRIASTSKSTLTTLPLALPSEAMSPNSDSKQLSIREHFYPSFHHVRPQHQQTNQHHTFVPQYSAKIGETSSSLFVASTLLLPSVGEESILPESTLEISSSQDDVDHYLMEEDGMEEDEELLVYDIVYDDDEIEFMLQNGQSLTMQDITQMHQSRSEIKKSTHKNEYGLFISWDMVTALLSCLIGGLFLGRFFYLKKKRKWRQRSGSYASDLPHHEINELREEEADGLVSKVQQMNSSENSLNHGATLPLFQKSISVSGEKDREADFSSGSPVLRSTSLPILNKHSPQSESDKPFSIGSSAHNYETSRPGVEKSDVPTLQATTMSDTKTENSPSHITTAVSDRKAKQQAQNTGNLDGIPLVRYSRYRSEFNEISALGKGGFGTVFKCTNTLDGREYAVKKVLIRTETDSNGRLTEQFSQKLQRVLREVKILALLDHPHIIRYYTAWIESEEDADDGSTGYLGASTFSDPSLTCSYSSDLLAGNTQSEYSSYNSPYRSRSSHHTRKGSSTRYSDTKANPLGWNTFLSSNDQNHFDQPPDGSNHPSNFIPDHHQNSSSIGSNEDLGFTWDHGSSANLLRLATIHDTTSSDTNTSGAAVEVDQTPSIKDTVDTDINDNETNDVGNIAHQSCNGSLESDSSQSTTDSSKASLSSQEEITNDPYIDDTITTNKDKGINKSQYTQDPSLASSATDGKQLQYQKHILYIQMQLSKKTLLDHFQAREESEINGVDIPSALTIFSDIAHGVKHVHEMGLIHRDLKPSNCFMDDSGIKIGDFGLSRESGSQKDEIDDTDRNTQDSGILEDRDITAGVGTSSYASPEQMNGSDYNASTDVYSLGIILFELCYPMYTGMERFQVFDGIRRRVFPSKWHSTVGKQFPSIHNLLLTMLSQNPADRPSSTDVANEIKSFLSEYTVLSLALDSSSKQEGSIFLRVEADDNEGVLARTMKLMKEAATDIAILQYSLRGQDSKAIMEFALVITSNDDDDQKSDIQSNLCDPIESIFIKLQESREIKLVRQVNHENTSISFR